MGWNCKYYDPRDTDDCYGLHKAGCSCCGNCLRWDGEKCMDFDKVLASEKKYDKYDRMIRNNRGAFID